MIRKANKSDIDSILVLTQACAKDMISKGIYQWNEHYPNAAAFEKDVEREELYVLILEHKIVGTVVISSFMDDVYQSVKWLTSNGKNLYIHRLAVHPEHQGHGLAQKMMDFAENYGITNGYVSIRLDTFSQNQRNQTFYEYRGYQRLGSIYFPMKSDYPFYCYERLL